METIPSVTVLMPVYNAAMHLREAIDSILHQTFTDFELLIIEDGADNATKQIISIYNDPRIRVVSHAQNKGLIYSLNEGIELALGKYIVRMDADDISLPERIASQVKWMDAHPQIAVCGTNIEDVDGKVKLSRVPVTYQSIKASLLFSCCIAHPTVIVRKEELLKGKFRYDPEFVHAEDYELWSRMVLSCELRNMPNVFLKYRLHEKQVSREYSHRQIESMRKVQAGMLKMLGMEFTREDLLFHSGFALMKFGNDSDYCRQASRWLIKLWIANKQSNSFESTAFREVLSRFWYSFCAFQLDQRLPLKYDIYIADATKQLLSPLQKAKLGVRLLIR